MSLDKAIASGNKTDIIMGIGYVIGWVTLFILAGGAK